MLIQNNNIYIEDVKDIRKLKFAKNLKGKKVFFNFVFLKDDYKELQKNRLILENVTDAHFNYLDYDWQFEFLPNLEHFSFNECCNINLNEHLKLEKVKSVEIENFDFINLVSMLPNLEKLTIRNTDGHFFTIPSSVDYKQYLNKCSHLKELIIERQGNLSELDLSNFDYLDRLIITGNPYLNKIILSEKFSAKDFEIFDNGQNSNEIEIFKNFIRKNLFDNTTSHRVVTSVFNYNVLQKELQDELNSKVNSFIFQKLVKYGQIMNRNFLSAIFSYDEMSEIDDEANKIISSLNVKEKASDFEKFLNVYSWLIQNTTYDNVKYNTLVDVMGVYNKIVTKNYFIRQTVGKVSVTNNVVGAIRDKSCVCEGYSYALKYLLAKLGVCVEPVNVFVGYTGGIDNFDYQNIPNHSMTKVIINNKALYCDLTFDQTRYCDYKPRIEIQNADEQTQEFLDIINDEKKDRELILQSLYYPLETMLDCKTIIGEEFILPEYIKTKKDKILLNRENKKLIEIKTKENKEYLFFNSKEVQNEAQK